MMDLALKRSKFVIVTSDDLHDESFDDIVADMLENNTKNNYLVMENRGNAIEKGISLLKSKDILLILGKGHEDFIIIGDKKIPFNDKKVVENLIKEKINI